MPGWRAGTTGPRREPARRASLPPSTDRRGLPGGAAAGQSDSAAMALSALHQFLDDPPMDRLRQVLGLTPSGTVRLVDRLAGRRLRHAAAGPRRPLGLAAPARRPAGARRSGCRRRAPRCCRTHSRVSPGRTGDVRRAAVARLVAMIRGPGATRWMCRLCDPGACRARRAGARSRTRPASGTRRHDIGSSARAHARRCR